ncbi:SDR family oxidoreductase [Aurantimonas sp. 22II-16-19i]|uniref:SDR family NAD(P)-dependent oxidoreductase n=1 Tax=Aurantimonas sp. 22II-16-19i TaxID=1317114 RepID=UPI0009F7E9F4|nr:SDR family oxidoreductase [Aurantimonas sp. 22II-16-19i]ORE90588.1 putative dehydrogenase [Aurantimonas sp. 22II-16-19i]
MTIRSVFITGIASGVGAKIAARGLAAGMNVYGCDIDAEAVETVSLRHEGQSLTVFRCDIADTPSLFACFDEALSLSGGIDALVNNAGLYLGQPIAAYDDATIERVIAVNLTAPMKLSRRFAEAKQRAGGAGAIVNIASVAGEVGSSDAVYGSVKAAVIGLTKSNAMNFAPAIRVNAVSPGLIVDTAIARAIPDYRYAEYKRQEMLDGDLTTDSVADVVAFLLSPASRSMTGAILRSDNGCYPR